MENIPTGLVRYGMDCDQSSSSVTVLYNLPPKLTLKNMFQFTDYKRHPEEYKFISVHQIFFKQLPSFLM